MANDVRQPVGQVESTIVRAIAHEFSWQRQRRIPKERRCSSATLRSGMSIRWAGVVVLLLPLFACGEATGPTGPRANELVFTRPDGTTFSLTPDEARCVPSGENPAVRVVLIQDTTKPYNLKVQAFPGDVEGGKTFDLPVTSGSYGDGPENAYLFYAGADAYFAQSDEFFKVSTSDEHATGTMKVRATCEPVVLELEIDAFLGSNYFDGEGLEVKGSINVGG
jgi:hypothetical protein